MYNKVTFMAKQNTAKKPPKGSVRFSLSLSPEQKSAKQAILHHPYNFIIGTSFRVTLISTTAAHAWYASDIIEGLAANVGGIDLA